MHVRSQVYTDRALALLEEYCKKLKKPEEQQLKKAIKKVMGIFKSSLFQALIVQVWPSIYLDPHVPIDWRFDSEPTRSHSNVLRDDL
uniref:L27-1 domain-containing protein n=1 Tax=Chelydra serpentina TaxID=8475 RepID=A0A8C3RHM7_CHESE